MGPTMDAIGRISSSWGEWPCCDGRQPHEIIKCNPRKETRTEANKLLADMVIRCESLIILVANWLMRKSSNAAGLQHVSLARLQSLGSPSTAWVVEVLEGKEKIKNLCRYAVRRT